MTIYLENYSIEEIIDILKARANEGIKSNENLITEREYQDLAELTYLQNYSLRVGISALSNLIDKKVLLGRDLTFFEIESLFENDMELDRLRSYHKLQIPHRFVIKMIIQILNDKRQSNKAYIEPTFKEILKYWNKNYDAAILSSIGERTLRRYLSFLRQFEILKEEKVKNKTVGRPEIAYYPNFNIGKYTLLEKQLSEENNGKGRN